MFSEVGKSQFSVFCALQSSTPTKNIWYKVAFCILLCQSEENKPNVLNKLEYKPNVMKKLELANQWFSG